MKRFVALTACFVLVLLLPSERQVAALGFNTAMLYRYPWIYGNEAMDRTQGWGEAASHYGPLHYAVDWDDGSGNWLVRSANGGTIRCDGEGGVQSGFGAYVAVYNSVADQTSIYAHLVNCGFFQPLTDYPATQGQGLWIAGETGHASGIHLHFHVINGDEYLGPHTTVPFAMSDQDNFAGTAFNQDSDNAGVGFDAADVIDSMIRDKYLSNGGDSGSWWNVGSPWASFGGPCPFISSPFIHTCSTSRGALRLQNYITWSAEPSAIAKNRPQTATYRVRGAIWRTLGGLYRSSDIVSNVLGPPLGDEALIASYMRQFFDAGRIHRYTDRVRQDMYIGSTWKATYYFQTAFPGECYDILPDGTVDQDDTNTVLAHYGESEPGPPWDPRYDVNHDGGTDLADALAVSNQNGRVCHI